MRAKLTFFWRISWRIARLLVVVLAAAFLLVRSTSEPGDKTEQVRAFTRQIEFDYLTWTLEALQQKLAQMSLGVHRYLAPDDQHQVVMDYVALIERIQRTEAELQAYYASPEIIDPEAASVFTRQELQQLSQQRQQLEPLSEAIVQAQLGTVTADLGLGLGGQPVPPVLYRVTPLPLALVVSPREVIRQDENISVAPSLTIAQRAALEDQVAQRLDVSTLVVNIGGVGLYPTMVKQTSNFNWMIEVVAHEWVHNYLTLRPLGLSYMKNNTLRTINESVANMAGKEISAALIAYFYPERVPPPEAEAPADEQPAPESESPPPFDYRAAMHETRLTVDALLAAGKIVQAENYMEARRQLFLDNGYNIRKLNQAWFAFHGAYADVPGGASGAAGEAEDPVGDAIRTLRAQSESLADFLFRVSWIWNFDQLEKLVN